MLARSLQNVTIIQKGEKDIISNGLPIPKEFLAESSSNDKREALTNETQGGLKRVGGQGDILSGSTGVLLAWGSEWVRGTYAYVKQSTMLRNLTLQRSRDASTIKQRSSGQYPTACRVRGIHVQPNSVQTRLGEEATGNGHPRSRGSRWAGISGAVRTSRGERGQGIVMSSGFSIVNYSTMHVGYRRSIHLQALLVSIATVSDQVTHHPVVDLVVSQRDVVLESSVPCCQFSIRGRARRTYHFFSWIFCAEVPV